MDIFYEVIFDRLEPVGIKIALLFIFKAFFYNIETKSCEKFVYGGCGGNNNRFESKDQCENQCTNALGLNACQDCKLAITYLGEESIWIFISLENSV